MKNTDNIDPDRLARLAFNCPAPPPPDFARVAHQPARRELDLDELDHLAAAGTPDRLIQLPDGTFMRRKP